MRSHHQRGDDRVNSKISTFRTGWLGQMKWAVAAVTLATVLVQREAGADILLAEQNDWKLSLDGRLNAFINYSQGDRVPAGVAEWTAGLFEPADPNSGKIGVIRVRSGFVQ